MRDDPFPAALDVERARCGGMAQRGVNVDHRRAVAPNFDFQEVVRFTEKARSPSSATVECRRSMAMRWPSAMRCHDSIPTTGTEPGAIGDPDVDVAVTPLQQRAVLPRNIPPVLRPTPRSS